jgi:hypothetical protein
MPRKIKPIPKSKGKYKPKKIPKGKKNGMKRRKNL